MKKGVFEWSRTAQRVFEDIKQKLYQASVLALLNFEELFELEFDASGVRIGVILI